MEKVKGEGGRWLQNFCIQTCVEAQKRGDFRTELAGRGDYKLLPGPFEAVQISNTALAPSLAWNPHFCNWQASAAPHLTFTKTSPPVYLQTHHLHKTPKKAVWTQFLCTTGVCKWIYYHADTASYVLTHHFGVCRPGQTTPLAPSISPGDDPEDEDRWKGQIKSTQNPLKDSSQSLLTPEFLSRLGNPITREKGQ